MPDLTIKAAGALEIRIIEGETPAISVIRIAGGTYAHLYACLYVNIDTFEVSIICIYV